MFNRNTPQSEANAIVECPQHEFVPGRLGECFRNGVKAVLLDDPRAAHVWNRLLGPMPERTSTAGGSLPPWEATLPQVAKNHLAGNIFAGDMLRFIPGGIGHIARRIILVPVEDGSIVTIPAHFSHKSIPEDDVRVVWKLMTDVLRSTYPADSPLPPYRVTIEMLKYPNSFDEVEQIVALLGDTFGGCTRLGMRMDTWRWQAAGLFATPYLREIVAFASLIPGLRKLIHTFNRWMTPLSYRHVPEGTSVIGGPHTDGSKIVTALLSERETLTTEVHTGQRWLDLPLTTGRLAIFPSARLDPRLSILPTLHRILIQTQPPVEQPAKPNITLSLTVQPH